MYGTEFARINGSYSSSVVGTYENLGQNIEGNYTNFRLHLYFVTYGGTVSSTYSTLKIDGDVKQSGGYQYSTGEHWLGSKDITVYHNADGSFPGRYVEIYAHSYIVEGTSGGWLSAGTIPRASQPSCITYPNNTENVGAIGDSFFIHMNRKSASFTHTVKYNWYNRNETIATGVTDNYYWTIPEIFASDIPNQKSGWGTIIVDTYNGSTYIGTKSCKFVCNVTNADPTFTNFDFEDVNEKTLALTGDNKTVIVNYSDLYIEIKNSDKAIGNKYATITKYRVLNGNNTVDINYSDTLDVNTNILASSGIINVYAIDSRNNSTLVTKHADTIINYNELLKNNISVNRQNGISEFVTLKISGVIDLVDFGNVTNSIKQAKYRYKRTTGIKWSNYKDLTLIVDEKGNFSYNGLVEGDEDNLGFAINTSYNFEVYVEDELSNVTFTATLNSGIPNIALHKNGVGIMGKYDANKGGLLQVAGEDITHKSIITLKYLRHVQNNPSSWNTIVVNNSILNDTIQGDKLTYNSSDNSIVIGNNVSKVLVSAHLSYKKNNNSDCALLVLKNGENASPESQVYGYTDASKWNNYTISPVIINVKEGDVLQLAFQDASIEDIEFLEFSAFTVQEI